MKNIKVNPKNNFNSKNEREKYLNIFGETPIFFGSKNEIIMNLNKIEQLNEKSENTKKIGAIRSPSLIEVANLMDKLFAPSCCLVNMCTRLVIRSEHQD